MSCEPRPGDAARSTMFLSAPTFWSSRLANEQHPVPSQRRPQASSFGLISEEDRDSRSHTDGKPALARGRNVSSQCDDSHNCEHQTRCLARRAQGAQHALAHGSVLLRCPRFGPPVVRTKHGTIPRQRGMQGTSFDRFLGNPIGRSAFARTTLQRASYA
jgi:hypothetical protein